MGKITKKSAAGANICSAMGRETIPKSRVSPKNVMSRKNFLMLGIMLLLCGTLAAQKAPKSINSLYVEINGVKWATCNVDAPGTFAASEFESGMLYQFNRKIGWSANNPLVNSNGGTTWDNTTPNGTTWEAENDPSPEGYRVPTHAEMESLLDTTYVARFVFSN